MATRTAPQANIRRLSRTHNGEPRGTSGLLQGVCAGQRAPVSAVALSERAPDSASPLPIPLPRTGHLGGGTISIAGDQLGGGRLRRALGDERLVLLALADACCAFAGTDCWRSATIARKANISDRTVRRVITRFEADGPLTSIVAAGAGSTDQRTRRRETPMPVALRLSPACRRGAQRTGWPHGCEGQS